jgi:hypothetical protein
LAWDLGRVMATGMRRPYVNTDTTDTPLTRVRPMVTTDRAGFPVEYLSEPGLGSVAGAFSVEGSDRASVVVLADAGSSADAVLLGDAALLGDVALPGDADLRTVRLADSTVAAGSMAGVADSMVAVVDSTAAADMAAAVDTGNGRLNRSSPDWGEW